jgi:aspartate racemase
VLGVLGGLGPAATVDFLDKLVRLTPARRDQEHIPVVLYCQPRTPDRSAAILNGGPSPLPWLVEGVARLAQAGARVLAIPCNSSHHWFQDLQAAAPVPILHIADAALAALAAGDGPPGPVAVLATRGTLASGFYQRRLAAAGHPWLEPGEPVQAAVDDAIRAVKAGELDPAARNLAGAWRDLAGQGAGMAILACTELPVAAGLLPPPPFPLVDASLELARACVDHVLAAPWFLDRPRASRVPPPPGTAGS